MSSSNLIASMDALNLNAPRDDKNSEATTSKTENKLPSKTPVSSNRPKKKKAKGRSAKPKPAQQGNTTTQPAAAAAATAAAVAEAVAEAGDAQPVALVPSPPQARKPSRPKQPKARWSMYPSLHNSVSQLLSSSGLYFTFLGTDSDSGLIREYDTFIMGKFRCWNGDCPKVIWTSGVVAITIRMYPGERYNARVYHQRCDGCNALSKPILDESYAQRIAYRLKKWSGVEVEPPVYKEGKGSPHSMEGEEATYGATFGAKISTDGQILLSPLLVRANYAEQPNI
ncbi:hypothetical protein V490_00269 [Pseudogymnoascus sp. VKM F-3557]|nr:hypothetical protein V490_00269 [Pseudogymnoascus sp. VKM F-3557]